MEAPAGVARRLAGGTACGGFVMVVPASCWSCSVMEVEAARLAAGLSDRRTGADCSSVGAQDLGRAQAGMRALAG